MYLDPVSNWGRSTLAAGIDAVATSFTVASTTGGNFPATPNAFNVVIWNFTDYPDAKDDPNREIVRVGAHTGGSDSFTSVSRAQEGTAASTHNTGGKTYAVELAWTKRQWDLLEARLDGSRSFFRGKRSADQTITGSDQLIQFDQEDFDDTAEFNEAGSTNKFKAKRAGRMYFSVRIFATTWVTSTTYTLELKKNGTAFAGAQFQPPSTNYTAEIGDVVKVALDDLVECQLTVSTGSLTVVGASVRTRFLGYATGFDAPA